MGNDEHSQNVFKKAQEEGLDPLAYCDEMEQVFRKTWAHLDVSFDDFIRTTEPRHRAGVTAIAQRIYDAGDIYEGVYEGWYCVGCEEFKQEKDLVNGLCTLHPTLTPEWIREKNYFFRLSKYQQPLLDHFAAHPDFMQPEARRNEILRLLEGGLDRRLGEPRRPVVGHPAAVGSVERGLRLVRRADQLRVGGRPRHRPRGVRHVVAGRPPCDRQGHHALSRGDLAGDADVGRDAAAAADFRAWLHDAERPAHEQDARHDRRSHRGSRPAGPRSAAAVSREGDRLRIGWRLHLGTLRGSIQRRPREQPREPRQPGHRDGREISRPQADAGAGAGSGRLAGIAGAALEDYSAAMDRLRARDGRGRGVPLVDAANDTSPSTEPWALARDAARADQLTQVLFDVAEAVRVAAILLLPVMPTSSAEILRRMGETRPAPRCASTMRAGRPEGERVLVKGDALWPRAEAAGGAAAHKQKSQRSSHVTDATQRPPRQHPRRPPHRRRPLPRALPRRQPPRAATRYQSTTS